MEAPTLSAWLETATGLFFKHHAEAGKLPHHKSIFILRPADKLKYEATWLTTCRCKESELHESAGPHACNHPFCDGSQSASACAAGLELEKSNIILTLAKSITDANSLGTEKKRVDKQSQNVHAVRSVGKARTSEQAWHALKVAKAELVCHPWPAHHVAVLVNPLTVRRVGRRVVHALARASLLIIAA